MTIASMFEIFALTSVLPFLSIVIGGSEFGTGFIKTLDG